MDAKYEENCCCESNYNAKRFCQVPVKVFGPRTKDKKTTTSFSEGANKYIGMTFVTSDELDMYDPTLQHVYGDDWQVVSIDRRIPAGSEVKVISVNGTKLEVQTKEG